MARSGTPEIRTLRSRKGYRRMLDPAADTTDLDLQLREAAARQYIRELVDPAGWPPLSAEVRAELAALLAPPEREP